MTIDLPTILRVGQAVNACYDPFFLDRPERAVLPAPHQVIWGHDGDGPRPYGAIYLDPVLDAVVCVMRGTDSDAEWISDAQVNLVTCPFIPRARTHAGFTQIYTSLNGPHGLLRDTLSAFISPLTEHGNVIVAGHSLGAALATLAAVDFMNCQLITFASPKVGDDEFCQGGHVRLASCTRVVNSPDFVPMSPLRLLPLFPYAHLGDAMEFNSGSLTRQTPQAWHSMGTYLHLLAPEIPLEPAYAPEAQ